MAVVSDNSNPTSYDLEILTIVNNEGNGFDIRDLLLNCKIYESITSNYLTGTLSIVDSINLFETAKLFGQESLRIKFAQPAGIDDETHPEDKIDKIFRVYKITNISKPSQQFSAYTLHFCSQELIQSKRERISQAFRGSMTDICAVIGEQYLDIKNSPKPDTIHDSYFEIREKSKGDNFHVIIPNYTVNYTMNYLCRNAQSTDKDSSIQDSFFFFQTANGGFRIQSISKMLNLRYAGGRPFSYVNVQDKDPKVVPTDKTDEGFTGSSRRILNHGVSISADVLNGTTNGLFGSKQITIDNTLKFYGERTYDFLERFYAKDSSIETHPFIRTQPETLHIGTSANDGGDVSIVGSKEFKPINAYHDANLLVKSDSQFVHHQSNTIVQAGNDAASGADQLRQATKGLLDYHTMQVVISGRTDISCGQLINLEIPISSPGEDNVSADFYNGFHLITECMWKLTPSGLETHLKCMKDSVITNIETTVPKYGDAI